MRIGGGQSGVGRRKGKEGKVHPDSGKGIPQVVGSFYRTNLILLIPENQR